MLLACVLLTSAAAATDTVPASADPASRDATSLHRGDAYGHLIAARLALADGRFDRKAEEAATEISAAVEILPHDADLLGEGAGLMLLAGRRSEAESLARRALVLVPSQRTAQRVLGDIAAQRALASPRDAAQRAEAIRIYQSLAPDDPQSGELWMLLVRLKMLDGDVDGAIDAARHFAAVRAGDPNAVRLLTQALLGGGRRVEALDAVIDWLRRTPDDDGAVPMLAEIAHELEPSEAAGWDRVAAVMDGVVEAQPGDPLPRLLRGEALLRTGRPREAIADLEAAREGGRGGPSIVAQLCTAYMAANRLADAADEARSLVREFPDNAAVRSLYADALSRQGRVVEAIDQYDLALRSLPGRDAEGLERRDDLRRRIADLQLSRDKPAEAAKVLAALENPDELESMETRARAALRAGNGAEARRLAGKLRAQKETGAALMIEGEALAREGKIEGAREKFRDAVAVLGHRARVPAAAIFREAGHAAEGEKLLRAWVAERPEDPNARFYLGGQLERAGRFAEAEPELREAIRLAGDFDEALNYLGYALIDRGAKLEEALGMVRRALELDPDNGAYLDSLGWGLFRLGRYDEARGPLERAVREFPNDATVLEHLGDLYGKLGDSPRAGDLWRRALEAGPEQRDELERKLAAPPVVAAPR